MKLLEIALSSVVIVAIIEMTIQNKKNSLHYVTNERNEWRRAMKRITVKIYDSDSSHIGSVLTELKVNLNSYGRHDTYAEDKALNLYKDEHIWKEIDYIEKNCIKYKDENLLKVHKEKLISYLSLLLKFDWERSKKEVYPAKAAFISVICYCLSVCLIIIGKYDITNLFEKLSEIKIVVELLLIPYIILWYPYIKDLIVLLRTKHWYNEIHVSIKLWIVGVIIYGIIWAVLKGNLLEYLLFFVAAFTLIIYAFSKRKLYIDYSGSIIDMLEIPNIIIYGYGDGNELATFKVINYFLQLDINVNYKIIEMKDISDSDLQEAMNSIQGNCPKKMLNMVGYILFKLRKKRYADLKAFIKENPQYSRVIVKRLAEEDERPFYTIGYQQEIWKNWFD